MMKKAFTLSEVLIALTVIGVVAAITIPSINIYFRHTQMVSQLKKAYSDINNAVRNSAVKYGTYDSWNFVDFPNSTERVKYFSENYILPYISTIKTCVPSTSECWNEDIYTIDGNKKVSYISNSGTGHASFVAASGYSVYYWLHGAGNGAWFYVDINGAKKPNSLGKDVFPFIMTWGENGSSASGDVCELKRYGLYPAGLECSSIKVTREDLINGIKIGTSDGFNCKRGTGKAYAGGYCGALIMRDSWQTKIDYPW